MKPHYLLNSILFTVFCAILSLSSPALAAPDPLILQAQDQLRQALNAGGPAPSDEDKTALLKSALNLLKQSPAAVYRGPLKRAIAYVKSAIFEMSSGAQDNKAKDYIYKALDELRAIT
jgi:hypothetical protein